MIAEGDLVAVRHTARGTHRGEGLGVPPIPPTNKEVTVPGISIVRIADGKIVEPSSTGTPWACSRTSASASRRNMGCDSRYTCHLANETRPLFTIYDSPFTSYEIPHLQKCQRRRRLKAANDKIVADSSEGYSSKQACKAGLELVKGATNIPVIEDA